MLRHSRIDVSLLRGQNKLYAPPVNGERVELMKGTDQALEIVTIDEQLASNDNFVEWISACLWIVYDFFFLFQNR